ncbi:hypothetical protein JB92DRAFT_3289822 [Gautieria morchelliformis]|nr:hypothetical protein JB92DRAFT_3289822 [Gautieria morchelliformis]
MDANHANFTLPKKRPRLLDATSDGMAQPTLESLFIRESELRMELKEIREELNRRHVPPVNKLPVELLTMIFGFLVAISPDDIVRVWSVCRKWRYASEPPELWSTIIFSRDHYAFVDKVKLYWKMSLTHPVKVSYTQSIDFRLRRVWHAWQALTIHHDKLQKSTYGSKCGPKCGYNCGSIRRRLITFSVTFDDCKSARPWIPRIDDFPSLKALSVSIRDQSQDQEDEGEFGFERFHATKTPWLRSLNISTHILPKTPSLLFAKLTRLQVTDTFHRFKRPMNGIEPIRGKHILDVLRFCPNLEDFSFDGETSSGRVPRRDLTPAIQNVRLLKLRHLGLICHYTVAFTVLSGIVAPNVEDVVLRIFPRDRSKEAGEPSGTAGKFVARCPKIRTLWLYGLNHNALFGTSSGLQLLEKLHLEHVPGLDIIANRLRAPNQLDVNTDLFWFIPRLCTLSIVANLWDVPFGLFAKAIKDRYGTNNQRTSSVPARIQKYVVNGQNLLAAEGEVAKYSAPNRFSWNPEWRSAGVREFNDTKTPGYFPVESILDQWEIERSFKSYRRSS